VQRIAWPVIRGWCRWKVRRDLSLRIEGGRFVPRRGPALIVCNHYHHLYDGCALIAAIRRPVRIVVALDWAQDRRTRLLMEAACRAARWPVILRGERVTAAGGAYAQEEVRSFVRRGLSPVAEAGATRWGGNPATPGRHRVQPGYGGADRHDTALRGAD